MWFETISGKVNRFLQNRQFYQELTEHEKCGLKRFPERKVVFLPSVETERRILSKRGG